MSDIFGAAVAAAQTFGPLIGDLASNFALIISPQTSIGTLIPDVSIEELHHDEMAITLHPVETGAPITDHAFPQPSTVEIRCGWSDSTAQTSGWVQAVYQQFLQLEQAAQPFDVMTVKRMYQNMLVRSLAVKTDEASTFTLNVVALLQEIIITSTQQTQASSSDQNTGGDSAVATTSPDGNFNVQGNAPQATAGTISPDAQGNYGFANSPYNAGSQIIQPAPAGTPTVESLTQNQGV